MTPTDTPPKADGAEVDEAIRRINKFKCNFPASELPFIEDVLKAANRAIDAEFALSCANKFIEELYEPIRDFIATHPPKPQGVAGSEFESAIAWVKSYMKDDIEHDYPQEYKAAWCIIEAAQQPQKAGGEIAEAIDALQFLSEGNTYEEIGKAFEGVWEEHGEKLMRFVDGKFDGWFKCDICAKRLPTEIGLSRHRRYHTKQEAGREVDEAIQWATDKAADERIAASRKKEKYGEDCYARPHIFEAEKLETLIRAAKGE